MSISGINRKIYWCLYIVIMSIDFTRTQSPIGGGGFLADPFLELNAGITTPAVQKSNKSESSCVSNGALAGSIIGTLILSAFIGFLTWLIYLRPKFQELQHKHLPINRRIPNVQQHHHLTVPSSISNHKKQQIDNDDNSPELPLNVTDYKFGTFPFRQSQTSSINGHYNRTDWLNRVSSSFRSVNMDQDFEMIDIELLKPTFNGLNFSITGNMRAGIFVKEILDKGQIKINSSNQLKTGDRIMALTVCFESIVYEDALTILSYASPYPVILRIQRPINQTKVNVTNEKRSTTMNTTNKVKWRDDFEHYDNDTQVSRSFIPPNPPPPPLPSLPTNSKVPSSPQIRSSTKKTRPNSNTQPRHNNKSSLTNKSNKLKTSSTSVLATSGATTKRPNNDTKKSRTKTTHYQRPMLTSTGLTPKSSMIIPTTPTTNNKKTVKSVTDAVISYLHYKGSGGVEHTIDRENHRDVMNHSEPATMPYYDSPYDYYYGGQLTQYQYLHQSHLNKNNNNSLSTESLTAITPTLARSVYTLHFSSIKSSQPIPRRCERRLSSPAIITTTMMDKTVQKNENIIQNIDTFV